MKPKFGIPDKKTKEITSHLKVFLGDLFCLYIKTQGFHWNIEDPRFGPLHKLFQKQYESLAETIDLVAERVRKLGFVCPSTMKEFLSLTKLKEDNKTKNSDKMLKALAEDYEFLMKRLRKDITMCNEYEDHGSADMLTDVLRDFEKQAWILRSHL